MNQIKITKFIKYIFITFLIFTSLDSLHIFAMETDYQQESRQRVAGLKREREAQDVTNSCTEEQDTDKRTRQDQEIQYSINLMWVNSRLNPEQKYIFPNTEFYLNCIFKWAQANSGSIVNLWFDSAMTPIHAIENTAMAIEDYKSFHPEVAIIRLRDVRTLPKVQEFSEVFSNQIPVYFRVDLLRLIIALHMLQTNEIDYFVYADLDMRPINKEQIFDQVTIQNLLQYGIVMAQFKAFHGFENGFQIISKNQNLLQAIDFAMIKLNIMRARKALKDGYFPNINNRRDPKPMHPIEQIIYDSYPNMFKYFYFLEGYGQLKKSALSLEDGKLRTNFISYDKNIHRLKPFGINKLNTNGLFFIPNDKNKFLNVYYEYDDSTDDDSFFEDDDCSDKKQKVFRWLWVPTKKVKLPPSHF
ncbi:hypothetical protein K9L05_00525 [Candidatus Babeliales bacterium]|nr:hypothetical protein [Candidatus Babeliales bacterium]